jgi:hypothetical protein
MIIFFGQPDKKNDPLSVLSGIIFLELFISKPKYFLE